MFLSSKNLLHTTIETLFLVIVILDDNKPLVYKYESSCFWVEEEKFLSY